VVVPGGRKLAGHRPYRELELHVTEASKRVLVHHHPLPISDTTTCLSEAHSEVVEEVAEAAIEEEEVEVAEAHRAVREGRLSGRRRKIFST